MDSRASSSLSSLSSETMKADDRTMTRNADAVIDGVRQETIRAIENNFQKMDYDAIKQECMEAIMQSVAQLRLIQNREIIKNLQELKNKRCIPLEGEKRKKILKDELSIKIKEMMSRRMAREWQSTANENIENDTEELELKLWNEMSSILQEVYRNHRNTASSIRVSKQGSIDVIENRLSSLSLQVHASNISRVRYLGAITADFLVSEIKRRDARIVADARMKTKTLLRELDQLRHNAEQRDAEARSMCNVQ